MSDEWLFYPCELEDGTASIFFDHGIRETLNQIAPPQLLKVRVPFKHPRPDGLSSREEFQELSDLEDDLTAVVKLHGGIYVGRITVGGHRYLHIFTADSEADWSPRIEAIGARHGYKLRFVLTPDKLRDGYWQDLFPGDEDWRVISDLRLLELLQSKGDDPLTVRRIDHWAYFPSWLAAEQFAEWAEEQGYDKVEIDSDGIDPDGGKMRVRFAHEGTVKFADITPRSTALWRRAKELGGDYDGWETPVCKPSD